VGLFALGSQNDFWSPVARILFFPFFFLSLASFHYPHSRPRFATLHAQTDARLLSQSSLDRKSLNRQATSKVDLITSIPSFAWCVLRSLSILLFQFIPAFSVSRVGDENKEIVTDPVHINFRPHALWVGPHFHESDNVGYLAVLFVYRRLSK
jgi:hypothetical protein